MNNKLYTEDVIKIGESELPWEMLENKSVLITGANGMVGNFLIDVLMYRNIYRKLNCKIYPIVRNELLARHKYYGYKDNDLFSLHKWDVNSQNDIVNDNIFEKVDFVIHLASNTHPVAYSTHPIETILTNTVGTINMLEFALKHENERFVFVSSNEIYGENRGDVELFDETYCGYIDCNTLRAGYTESKRCGEALCQAYIWEKNMDIVIPRLTRTYGSTVLQSDTKVISQFLFDAVNDRDIVLKSNGLQYFSYIYVADAVSGILTVMLNGKSGETYNISDYKSDIKLRDLAEYIAEYVGKQVIYKKPDDAEMAGYSKVTKARLNNEKIKALGWNAIYDIKQGIARCIDILKTKDAEME